MIVDGQSVPLTPGMAVSVEIATGNRRILEYHVLAAGRDGVAGDEGEVTRWFTPNSLWRGREC